MNLSRKPVQRHTLKGARLRKHGDYQRAYAAARKRQSASMSWFLAPQGQVVSQSQLVSHSQIDLLQKSAGSGSGARVGLTAGKVLGKAHERNRIKRRMREGLRRHVDLLPAGFDLILHPRRVVLTLEFAKLEAEIVRILEQANAEARRQIEQTRGTAAERPTSEADSR
jgi:ribonuclease P protein component